MGTSFCTTVATSTSAGGGGAAAFGFRQPENSNEAAGSRATIGQISPKRERDFLLPRVRIVICIAEIPCLNLASFLTSRLTTEGYGAYDASNPPSGTHEVRSSRRRLSNPIESGTESVEQITQ